MSSRKIIILDTTLRDGEQTPGVNLNLSEKLKIAHQLDSLGVDIIEAGFPAASQGDFEAVSAVSGAVRCSVASLCRCVPADIEKGWKAVSNAKKPRLHLFIATSDIHMEYKLKMTPEKVLESAVKSVRLGRSLCEDIEFSCEDASRSDPKFLYRILEAVIDAGATTVNIPDTVGFAMPAEFAELIRGVVRNVPNIGKAVVSVHCHNDLGLASANTLAALGAGAGQAEVTMNGIGERAGNCSLEEVIMAIDTRREFWNLAHSIDTTRIYRTSQRVSSITSVPIPICKAVVGPNAFSHESGIHQHGVLSNPMTYEIMTPESVGKSESTLVLGKLSGRHAFADRLKILGFDCTAEEIDDAFVRFKDLADRKKTITDGDLEALVSQEIADIPEVYRMESFQVQSGNKTQAMASVTLIHDGRPLAEAATGEGPVDASYNAVARIIGESIPLSSYDIKAVTAGEDALGEVTVRIKKDGREHTGKGLATDIIEASILAYINAINRWMAAKAKTTA